MATKRPSAKKSTKKSAAKKPAKKSAKKSTKKSAKKSTKRLTKTESLVASPIGGGGVEIGFPPPNLSCIEACAAAYSRCLASGGNPQRCMKAFVSCLQGCFRRSGVGSVGGGGGILIDE